MRKRNPFLFNQSKFRYQNAIYDEQTLLCHMNLGLTNYKAYVGSNLGDKWELFLNEGKAIGDESAFFANPMGNQCVVVLRDGSHVILNRSYKVAEGQGLLTCIGGHPEPSVSLFLPPSIHNPSFVHPQVVDSNLVVNPHRTV